MSYEQYFANCQALSGNLGLTIFDEGHRLKNSETKSYQQALKTRCLRKVLLTGTPIQNNLAELFNCINLVNPCLFSSVLFKNIFIQPITTALSPQASS
jgi:SNF2 family DNA or RNA helicase